MALSTVDSLINSAETYGAFTRYFGDVIGATTTAATTGSGYVTSQRYPRSITMPAVGSGITGCVFTYIKLSNEDALSTLFAAIEYDLGTLTISGNSFSGAGSMPTTKTVRGTSNVVASAEMAFLVVNTALTATTPTITITYTNQAGTTGQTASLILPTSPAINTAFYIHPHLASGDTGIRAVTNMSTSAGTAGTLKVYGLLRLGENLLGTGSIPTGPDPLSRPGIPWTVAANDVIGFYRMGSSTANQLTAVLSGVADT